MKKQGKIKRLRTSGVFQDWQVVLTQGVHFWDVEVYFLELINNFCIFSWFADENCYYFVNRKIINASNEEQINLVEGSITRNGQCKPAIMHQQRLFLQNQIRYTWLSHSRSLDERDAIDIQISFKIEVQLGVDRTATKNLIKILFINYTQNQNTQLVFPAFKQISGKTYAYKPNFCQNTNIDQIVYPELKKTYHVTNGESPNSLILLLNQNNIKEVTFFNGLIKRLVQSGTQLPKIIGHPITLLLVLVINQNQQYNANVGLILQNYKSLKQVKYDNTVNINKEFIQRKLRDLIFKIIGQQNLLQHSFVQFFAQNLANQQFDNNFIKLVILYYKIFLNEQVSENQIRLALINDFYISYEQQKFNNTNYFSSVLKYIQFKHDLYIKDIFNAISHHMKVPHRKSLKEFTLLDLYRYNNIQYTFIGFDLNNEIVRFFNYQTTPLLPISAILSLIQILPTPFKSFTWKQSWGSYKYYSGRNIRKMSLVGHEIIDSKFLLECPLDLIEDPQLLQSYFSNNVSINTKIQAVTSSRLNVQEVNYIDELKTLLKDMKGNAIDSLPKFKLIWKILTTKNRIQIDLNNVQTLYQIPILQKLMKINDTFKNYLNNLNREVNTTRIFKNALPQFQIAKVNIEGIIHKTHRLSALISSKFTGKYALVLQDRSGTQLSADIQMLKKNVRSIKNLDYGYAIHLISNVKKIIKRYDLKKKYLYQQKIQIISKQIQRNKWIFDEAFIQQELMSLLGTLNNAELNIVHIEQNQVLSKTLLNQTFNYIFQQNQKVAVDEILMQIQVFKKSLQKLKIEENYHKLKNSIQSLNLDFYRLTYKISNNIYQIMERKIEKPQHLDFYSQFFQITPQLYNIKQILHSKFYNHQLIKDYLCRNYQKKPFHLILSGPSSTLFLQAHNILSMRDIIQNSKLEKIMAITSSRYHSVLAFLLCLNIAKDNLMSELVALNTLVQIDNKVIEDDDINIIELLARRIDSQERLYYFRPDMPFLQFRSKIQRKYPNLMKMFILLQNTIQNGNQYQLQKSYLAINKYDVLYPDQDIQKKSKEIQKYLQLQLQKRLVNKQIYETLRQNQEMLKQKIILNKIGLKFSIKILYKDPATHIFWYNIHKSDYQQLFLYKIHLINLLKKYNINPDITLLHFNQSNHYKIKLCFPFINQTSLKYQYITQDNQPHMQLVDLLLASVSSSIYMGAYPLPTQDKSKGKYLKRTINKIQGKFEPNFPLERYWSCQTLNSLPFNIIQSYSQDYTVLGFDLGWAQSKQIRQSNNLQAIKSMPQLKFKNVNNSRQYKQNQNRNLKAIDLISFWWTKPKKLTPQLKEIMFGNIYKSAFSRLYFFIQNSSYQYLHNQVQRRSILNLKDINQHNIKSRIISQALNRDAKYKFYYFKFWRDAEGKTIIECIKSSKNKYNWLYLNNKQLNQDSKIVIEQNSKVFEFKLHILLATQIKQKIIYLNQFNFSQQIIYLQFNVDINSQICLKQIQLLGQQMVRTIIPFKVEQKSYYYNICHSCGELCVIRQTKNDLGCILCHKKQDFKLCLMINQQTEQNIEKPDDFIEYVEPLKKQNHFKISNYLCCLGCFKKT